MSDQRWYLEVWTVPPDGRRYRDAHPEHRAKLQAMSDEELERFGMERDGMYCNTVESVGRVMHRTYKTKAGAERAAQKIRDAGPGAYFIEINPGFSLSLSLSLSL